MRRLDLGLEEIQDNVEISIEEIFDEIETTCLKNLGLLEQENYSMEGLFDKLKDFKGKLIDLKDSIDKNIKENNIMTNNNLDVLEKHLISLLEEIDLSKKPKLDKIEIPGRAHDYLEFDNSYDNYLAGLKHTSNLMCDINAITPEHFIFKTRIPKVIELLNKNKLTEEGLLTTFQELHKSKIFNIDSLMDEYIKTTSLPLEKVLDRSKYKWMEQNNGQRYAISKHIYPFEEMVVILFTPINNEKVTTDTTFCVGAGVYYYYPHKKSRLKNVEVKALSAAECKIVLTECITAINKVDSYFKIQKRAEEDRNIDNRLAIDLLDDITTIMRNNDKLKKETKDEIYILGYLLYQYGYQENSSFKVNINYEMLHITILTIKAAYVLASKSIHNLK